jgi:DNA-binding protein HU-beta
MEKSTDIGADVVTSRRQVKPASRLARRSECENTPMYIGYFACAHFDGRFNTRKSHDFSKQPSTIIDMAKALSKSQIAAEIAEANGISKKQAVAILEQLAELAYKHAKNSFTLPGLGKLVLVNRKARLGRNPATGEQIQIAAKKVVKFRVAKAAKDAILGKK